MSTHQETERKMRNAFGIAVIASVSMFTNFALAQPSAPTANGPAWKIEPIKSFAAERQNVPPSERYKLFAAETFVYNPAGNEAYACIGSYRNGFGGSYPSSDLTIFCSKVVVPIGVPITIAAPVASGNPSIDGGLNTRDYVNTPWNQYYWVVANGIDSLKLCLADSSGNPQPLPTWLSVCNKSAPNIR